MLRFTPLLLAMLLPAAPAVAEIYQWKDADGKVHFTDQPPANQKSNTVNIRTAPTSDAPAAAPAATATESPLERQKKLLKVMDEERAAKAEKDKKASGERQKRQMDCARLKDQQRQFAQGGRYYTVDSKGERIYKNDDEIAQQREKVNDALKKCR
ncbi:MAG: DUF4124 domain-containing protein [Fluviicoccus sp.]|uniref:DUF4124 domain-containing protein n=1 Tax=Fluviicoccus sp. TaxID=2003552 RepID=UPI002725BEDC|nr:DUF4124 domain-containing protein [Fluviicoccus sp.]MDO8331065.1 DUF4124 domain-containing protein [Fluviicoccus sp.]